MKLVSLAKARLGLLFACKFGAHKFDPNEIGLGAGHIDYYCQRCQRVIRRIALQDADSEDLANVERLRRRISQLPKEKEETRWEGQSIH